LLGHPVFQLVAGPAPLPKVEGAPLSTGRRRRGLHRREPAATLEEAAPRRTLRFLSHGSVAWPLAALSFFRRSSPCPSSSKSRKPRTCPSANPSSSPATASGWRCSTSRARTTPSATPVPTPAVPCPKGTSAGLR